MTPTARIGLAFRWEGALSQMVGVQRFGLGPDRQLVLRLCFKITGVMALMQLT